MPGPNENPGPPGFDPLTETFAFVCLDCGASWNRTFDLVPLLDPAGCLNPLEYVDDEGRAMHSPLTDAVCGACGSRKVRVG
ncbi:hypothetical protein OG241_27950 [Streptomyces sp. NBC_01390]|uniref:hypothetical protein n=1 Tax=Streptomyces sp. NBC_01390 TaxID=2903850 RepID=UPI0032521503